MEVCSVVKRVESRSKRAHVCEGKAGRCNREAARRRGSEGLKQGTVYKIGKDEENAGRVEQAEMSLGVICDRRSIKNRQERLRCFGYVQRRP